MLLLAICTIQSKKAKGTEIFDLCLSPMLMIVFHGDNIKHNNVQKSNNSSLSIMVEQPCTKQLKTKIRGNNEFSFAQPEYQKLGIYSNVSCIYQLQPQLQQLFNLYLCIFLKYSRTERQKF